MWSVLNEFLEDDDSNQKTIALHLNQLSIVLNSYFPKDISDDFQWI